MFRGKFRIAFLFGMGAALGAVPAFAISFGQARCNKLGISLANLTADAQSLGYFSLHQPIVMSGDSSGLSEDQARAASQKKIAEFESWLAGAQQVFNRSVAPQDCSYRQDSQQMIDYGRSLLANLKSFAGPYSKAQTDIPGTPAAVANGTFLDLPCRKTDAQDGGLRKCNEVIRDVTGWTEGFLKTMIDAMYRGCDLADSSTVTDPANCTVKNSVQTCNSFEGLTGIANTAAEQSTNHLGRSCGQWIKVGQSVSGSQCMISASAMGTMEQSYYQGNAIRALDCHWNQVKNEIAQGRLRLTAAKGLDPSQKYATQIALVKTALASLKGHKNIGEVEQCTDADLSSASAAKQSACMEYTHRLVLEQHFAHLAAVEVIDRARRSFERFDAGVTAANAGVNRPSFFADFQSYLQQNQNSSACQGKRADCNSSSSKYLTQCYQPLWKSFFTSRSAIWNAEVCQ